MNSPEQFLGHYPDLTNEQYHRGPGVSKSGVMKLARSPLHYFADRYSPSKEPTPAMVMGSLTHTLSLEPHKLDAEYIVAPDISRRSNAGKDAWNEFQKQAEGKQIISQEQLNEARKIASAVKTHPFAGPALSGGFAEHSYYWIDELSGVLAKCRPDYVKNLKSGVVLLDLKTTDDASVESFAKTCSSFGYHVSAAMSMDGYEAVTGIRPLAYKFIVVERSAPYGIAIYEMETRAIAKGREIYQDALCTYRECQSSGDWRGYPVNTQIIDLPAWSYKA